ncbi:MAG: hypothetical protein K2H41_01635 [Acetatifactor sp.]|nr:hypothetical protein [Acetatifactor sp.]MDE6701570.1 hypothetical protein [Acetatifactor sp.]MDE7269563.1 hypothetical protein [Acetatifactor sp.]
MDVNGLPIEGFQSLNLSAGLGATPPLPASMMKSGLEADGSAVTESEMEHIILEYKAAQSAREAEQVLDRSVPEGQMSRVLDGLENDFFSSSHHRS